MNSFEIWAWIGILFSLLVGFIGPIEYYKYQRRKGKNIRKSQYTK